LTDFILFYFILILILFYFILLDLDFILFDLDGFYFISRMTDGWMDLILTDLFT
jgi:hypothetical protein